MHSDGHDGQNILIGVILVKTKTSSHTLWVKLSIYSLV